MWNSSFISSFWHSWFYKGIHWCERFSKFWRALLFFGFCLVISSFSKTSKDDITPEIEPYYLWQYCIDSMYDILKGLKMISSIFPDTYKYVWNYSEISPNQVCPSERPFRESGCNWISKPLIGQLWNI